MNPYWKFPPTGGGNISGLNESGITKFKSEPVVSMTKETLQDSLDARKSGDRPAIVKFSLLHVDREMVPDVQGLTEIFKLGSEYWIHHEEASQFFLEGLNLLKSETIPIMAIQDYNTIGLSKIDGSNTQSNSGGWTALVRSTGITEKGPTDSGSFGIGKHAPFAASKIQTVLYGTLNEESKTGFQGVSKIASFLDENNDVTQGTGYFGFPRENDFHPLTDTKMICAPFKRSKQGTDKFIIGFDDFADWEYKVLKEAISSYMLAIWDEKLEVHINGEILNKNSLKYFIKYINDEEPNDLVVQFYKALTHGKSKKVSKLFKTEDGDKEEIVLYLLEQEEFNKRIVLYRNTGMKVYDRGHFRTPVSFAGVLIVKGDKLNASLRKMEPPTHDKWDPDLYKKNVTYARRLIRQINEWMNDATRDLVDLSEVESIELRGMEKLLPDLTARESSIKNIEQKSFKQTTTSIKKSKPNRNKRTKLGLDLGNEEDGIVSGGPEKQGDKKGRKRKTSGGTKIAKISKYKVFQDRFEQDTYIFRFWSSTSGSRFLTLLSVGENNRRSQVSVTEAKTSYGNVKVEKGVIGPIEFKENDILDIKIRVKSKTTLSLEVKSV